MIIVLNLVLLWIDNILIMVDFLKFLLCKDFLFIRFVNFDDCLENFNFWSFLFWSVILEFGVIEFEEMDLFVKWLGLEFLKFVCILCFVNIYNFSLGVKCIWDRLNDKYGRFEMVEYVLK